MTAANTADMDTVQLDSATLRRPWTAPAVERIEAGSAEIGSDVVADEGITKS